MRETMKQAWRQISERSPNRRISPGRVALVQLSRWNGAGIRTLLYGISVAAKPLSLWKPAEPAIAADPQEFSW
jgi:hypothetical protein